MASLQQLQNDVAQWLNRQDILTNGVFPGWVSMVETEISETLRSRFQVVVTTQPIDNAYISLPADFTTMESIRDNTSGELLDLYDQWSGHWTNAYGYTGQAPGPSVYGQLAPLSPCTAYRLVHDCIEFLPHPYIPNPPDPTWKPQVIQMGYYAKPQPLLLPTDTNPILDNLYDVYLFGVLRRGAMFERDDQDVATWDNAWQSAVTRANLWKQQSDYSGAPFRAILATVF
jgi:hypothetical protein